MADPRRRPAAARPRHGRRDRVHDAAGRRLGRQLRIAQPRLRDAGRPGRRGREPPARARGGRRRPGARAEPAPGARQRRPRGRAGRARRLSRRRHGVARGRRARHLGARPAAGRARRRLPHGGARRARRDSASRSCTRAGAGSSPACSRLRPSASGLGSLPSSGRGPARAATPSATTSRRRCARASATTSSPAAPISRPARGARSSAAGAAEVVSAGLCTICDPEWFHSHRRDGRGSGRQAVIAYIEEERA